MDYESIVGKQTTEELYLLAESLKGRRIKMAGERGHPIFFLSRGKKRIFKTL
jgi:hypothetical protein